MSAWVLLGAIVIAQIGYPLTGGGHRAGLVLATVAVGYLFSVSHAVRTRGWRAAVGLVAVTSLGGLAIETIGVRTGFPFGDYVYGDTLGPTLVGVPVVIPLAWTWMAWPAWIVAGHLVGAAAPATRVLVAGVGLAAWDLFLDPQMVAAGHWRWVSPGPGLPGQGGIVPASNYLGWLAVAVLMMALLAASGDRSGERLDPGRDAPAIALYLWTYVSSVLAHTAFLGLPASACWGGVGMGTIAVPLVLRLVRPRVAQRTPDLQVRR